MGQTDILRILKRKRKWMNSDQLQKILKQNKSTITHSLQVLVRCKEVERKQVKGRIRVPRYVWRIK